MQKSNQLFGGISVFLFGDILQLRPVQGSYIFDAPKCKYYMLTYLCTTHWHSFDVIMLEQNHRQGEDHAYVELLNQNRKGKHTSNDIAVLKTRVSPEVYQDIIGAMHISCTNKTVKQMNDMRLNELNTELYQIEAINIHPSIKNFQPKVNEKGTVCGTSILQTLKSKVGAKVMLLHNIHVRDGLANGNTG